MAALQVVVSAPLSLQSLPVRDFWKEAIDTMSEEDRRDIDFTQTNQLRTIENEVLAAAEEGKELCRRRRWKYKKGGHEIIIRDKLEKIVKWVTSFVQVGDTIIQYDPGHAALPWAGVRFLLKINRRPSA